MKSVKKVLALIFGIVITMGLVACGGNGGEKVPDTDSNLIDKATKLLQAEGREYNKLFTGKMNETLTSAFFEFKITDAATAEELEGLTPISEGYKFVVADVEVKNIFDETIPVGNYDFNIYWSGGEDIGYEEFFDGMYPDEVDLKVGESLSGKLVFEVPESATDIMVGYTEIWDDDFEGNVYLIEITP